MARRPATRAARLAEMPAGPAPHDDHVGVLVAAVSAPLQPHGDFTHRLLALFDGVADQAHATELAGHVETGNIGLEVRADVRQFNAPAFSSEHQGDGAHGTGGAAGAMADAFGRSDQFGLAADQAQHIAFRAGLHACAAANAEQRIDEGVQRGGLIHPAGAGVGQQGHAPALRPATQEQVNDDDEDQRRQIEQPTLVITDCP